MKIVITQHSTETRKLFLVKQIKAISDIGLMEAKDICDRLFNDFETSVRIPKIGHIVIEISDLKNIKRFISEVSIGCTGRYDISPGGKEFVRDRNLLTIGVGIEKDYSDFIINTIVNISPSSEVEDHISDILSILSKDQLQTIFDKLNTKVYGNIL